ncbi:MAG TPA: cupin domain-containing protein [Polyangiaceae bacterium]|nr:cupin domain-containing protein [Polyangiaceae bacterium]
MNIPRIVLELDPDDLSRRSGYEPLRPGIDVLWLYKDDASGSSCAVLRYQPGSEVPEHTHQGFEHVYILAGEQSDDRGSYPKGSFVINPPGTAHRVWSKDGCLVLIVWQRPVAFTSGSVLR